MLKKPLLCYEWFSFFYIFVIERNLGFFSTNLLNRPIKHKLMITKKSNNIPLLYFKHLSQEESIIHYVSTRKGGISMNEFDSLNLSYQVGDNPEYVRFNRFKLAGELGIHPERLVFARQQHTDTIKYIDGNFLLLDGHRKQSYLEATDALITKEPHICLSVLVGDCVPILFYDTVKTIIAVAHAGWKGSLQSITTKVVDKMTHDFLCAPANIKVGIGPCISKKNYVIDSELMLRFKNAFEHFAPEILNEIDENHHELDLVLLNKLQLKEAKIPESNIEIAGLCTFDQNKKFYSHRFAQGKTGRFACGIMIK